MRLIILLALLSGCAVSTDHMSARSVDLRAASVPEGMAAVFVGRDCPIAMPRHSVSIDGSERTYLECMRFARFELTPGEHRAAFSSTENTESLEFISLPGETIYIRMGFAVGSGMGDAKVTAEVMQPDEGEEMIASMQAVE